MSGLPRDPRWDATVALARDPYRYLSRTARGLGVDAFETRLLGRRTVCMTGRAAGRMFYDEARFRRAGAAPRPLRRTLFGEGGVQGLDGEAHRHRKLLLTSVTAPSRAEDLAERTLPEWRRAVARRGDDGPVELYGLAQEVLTRSVCAWAEVPLAEGEVEARRRELVAMFDGAGALGPRHLRARRARRRAERWLAAEVERVRRRELRPAEGSALAAVALHRDLDGELLDARVAAVELLNVLRPTVAISVYVVQLVHALQAHPTHATPRTAEERGCFVQELRRCYPFFPFVAARARGDVTWRDGTIPAGTRVLFDLYGTCHDPRLWPEPERFDPTRFQGREPRAFELVPQGGGDREQDHRCAGEPVTLAVLDRALRFFVEEVEPTLPPQDLELDLGRLPALPRSRVLLEDLARSEPGPAVTAP